MLFPSGSVIPLVMVKYLYMHKFGGLLDSYNYVPQFPLVYLTQIANTTLLRVGDSLPSRTFLRFWLRSILYHDVLQNDYHEITIVQIYALGITIWYNNFLRSGLSHCRLIKSYRKHRDSHWTQQPLTSFPYRAILCQSYLTLSKVFRFYTENLIISSITQRGWCPRLCLFFDLFSTLLQSHLKCHLFPQSKIPV